MTLTTGQTPPDVLGILRELCGVLGREALVAERDTNLHLRARRAERLTLAAELQWRLLPGRSRSGPEYDLGAQLEPAYAAFGEDMDAALLTNPAISALRNARRAGPGLIGGRSSPDKPSTDSTAEPPTSPSCRRVSTRPPGGRRPSTPGHLVAAARRHRRGGLDGGTPSLGCSRTPPYAARHFRAEPKDRLLLAGDGVYGVASPAGERAPARTMTATRLLPPSQVPRAVLTGLVHHRGEPPPDAPDDDAMVLCPDWHGGEQST